MSKNTTPSSAENIYAGFLEKKGGSISSKWQKRFIFIRGNKIGYAKSANENVLGTINKKNITGIDCIFLNLNISNSTTSEWLFRFKSQNIN
jgi:hypothetical protein